MWSLIRPRARHLVALAARLTSLLLLLYIVTKNAVACKEAARFVATDARVAGSIGPVQKTDFRFWEGFELTGNAASRPIEATSDKGASVFQPPPPPS
jgi:hypothetical protein